MSTAKDRVKAAIRREKADRYAVTAMLALVAAKVSGIGVKDFEEDTEKYYTAHMVTYEKYQPDAFLLYLNVFAEVEALGAKVDRAPNRASSLKSRVLENIGDLDKLQIIDPNRDGRFPVYLEAAERLAKNIPDAALSLSMMSPWTTAINMRGADTLIFDTADDPQFVHELMKFTTEVAKNIAVNIRKRGVGVGMSDSGASLNLISPPIYKNFVRPYNQELINYLKDRKIPLGMHACGYNDPIIEDIISLEPLTISIDAATSLEKFIDMNKGRVVVLGNVDTKLFSYGTLEEIEEAVKNCFDIAKKAGEKGFILCTGCDLPLTAKIENVERYFEAARKYGAY